MKYLIITCPTIVTWKRCTFVNLRATIVTREAWGTFTAIAVYVVYTGGSITTIVCSTLVYINFTMGSTESNITEAGVTMHLVDARSIVVTRRTCAFVDVHTAVFPCVTQLAVALVVVSQVCACSFVDAWVSRTVINIYFAADASETFRTCAFILIYAVNASAVVHAGRIFAIVHIDFAVLPFKTIGTLALKRRVVIKT